MVKYEEFGKLPNLKTSPKFPAIQYAVYMHASYVPLDESVLDLTVGPDFGRKESLRTMEDVHQDGELSLFQVTPHVIDVSHHILRNGCTCVSASVYKYKCM